METNQYMDMFLDESHEHLQSLNDGLLKICPYLMRFSVTRTH